MFYLGYQLPLRLAFKKTATGPLEVALTVIIDGSVWVDMYMQMRMTYARATRSSSYSTSTSLAPLSALLLTPGC